MADTKSSRRIHSGKWKIRFIGDKKKGYELINDGPKSVQEFQGVYTHNKYFQLFRFLAVSMFELKYSEKR